MSGTLWTRPVLLAAVPAHEGPVHCPDENALYYTTVPRAGVDDSPLVRIERLRLNGGGAPRREVVVEDANAANGMTRGLDGSLLVCEQGSRSRPARISRLDRSTGRRETVTDQADGFALSSPNDVVQTPDGAIWFTDPSYGHLQGFRPPPVLPDGVRRVSPGGTTHTASTAFDKPNGIATDADGAVLYVGDSGANHEVDSYDPDRPHEVWRHDISPTGQLTGGRRLAVIVPGYPDGLKVDRDGLVHVSCTTGVQVRSPSGELLDHVAVPGAVNLCLGGPEGRTLFVVNDVGVWVCTRTAFAPAPTRPERTPA